MIPVSQREPLSKIVRPLRSGQITIPAEFRKRLGIQENTLLRLTLAGDEIHLKAVRAAETAAGSPWLRELYDRFAPVRREALARVIASRRSTTLSTRP